MVNGFPDLYLLNGPQSPAPFFNPAILPRFQLDICELLEHAKAVGAHTIEPTKEAEDAWVDEVNRRFEETLIVKTNSWWMGSNISGKPRCGVSYRDGLASYRQAVLEGLDEGAFELEPGPKRSRDRKIRWLHLKIA